MPEWQKQVVFEERELSDKRSKLNQYLETEPPIHRDAKLLLERQIDAMDTYAGILLERIASFGLTESVR